jgi:putative transcription antitermination factor YqgF
MKSLGIDYGAKRIGLAKSAGKTAVPFGIIENDAGLFGRISRICDEENIEKIVVGMPYANEENDQMRDPQLFVDKLKKLLFIEVVIEDERMSTQMAKKRGVDDDSVAAMYILQSYLDKF